MSDAVGGDEDDDDGIPLIETGFSGGGGRRSVASINGNGNGGGSVYSTQVRIDRPRGEFG